ncbi:MAG: methyltransferase domain-containing protein [Kiritimatiellaeota bacterium]|nr:methyltransferase domain-containing protein [Kiritimatiellota bacterium]
MTFQHQRAIGLRFDHAAATYDRHTAIQWSVARRLLWEIEKDPAPRRILEIGCGTGLLTEQLRERFPGALVHALDLSPAMVAVARQRWRGAGRVRWHVADVRRFQPAGQFDLIVSNCALHWVVPLIPALRRIGRWLAPGGCFHAAIMLRGTLTELHNARRRVAPDKAPLRNLPTFAAVCADVRAAGFAQVVARRYKAVKSYPSAEALLRMLHEQGLTGGAIAGSGRLLTRGELQRLRADYDRRFQAKKGVKATYRVAHVCARKA